MRTSLNIPDEVLERFDQIWESQEFSSRSRAVREAMQEYIESHMDLDEMEGSVAAVIVFDYVYESIAEDIHEIQHEHGEVINAVNHVHHGNWCLETLHCSGNAEDVRELVYRLRNFDEIQRVKLMVVKEGDEMEGHTHDQT